MNISDGDFDKVIKGQPASGAEAAEMARIMRRLNSAYVSPMGQATEARHLAAIQQANRSRKTGTTVSTGLTPLFGALRSFGGGMRRYGLALSGSTAVWAVVVAMFLVTATGGLAAAGVLPYPLQSAVSQAAESVGLEVPRPEAPVEDVTMSDPASGGVAVQESDLAAQQAALASAEQAIAAAEQAQKAAQEAAAITARCIEESMAQVSTLVDGILTASSPAQAQAIVAQARNIGGGVKSCADQAAAAGQTGVGRAGEATMLAQTAAQGAPALDDQGRSAVAAAEKAARTAATSAGSALQMSQSIVDNVTSLAASLVNSSLGLQQAATAAAPPPPAAGTPAPPAGGNFTNPGAWAGRGMDYANEIMRSFMGGAGRTRR
ncbi:MAG TPA: hypothetical protein VHJ78_07445 [Actinomycetota bacterium]|nr:hypothetical protein [Actinomycetota bacterium]